jgi:NADH-quinone oxidoreductase subunit M
MNLLYLFILPLLALLLIALARTPRQIKGVALGSSLAQLGLILLLYTRYTAERAHGNTAPLLFEYNQQLIKSWNIHFHLGVDGISIAMLLLTSLVVVAGVLMSWKVEKMTKEFFLLLLLLSLGAYGFFISVDLFVLFFFLEISVIPKYLLIGIWGSGKKEYSANKLALLLMGGSALILVGMLGLYFTANYTFDMQEIAALRIPTSLQYLLFPLLFVGFGIFSALFPFHTWVPDGHSSAPTAGSMFLAGISMKLGGYGCLRVATYLLPKGAIFYADWIIVLAAIAILYGAFATMMQKDLKYLNAYSSISHVGFSLLGIGLLTQTAITGSLLQMVSHGLMTALFFAVIGMIYDRTHTRQVEEMGGLQKTMPFIVTIFFIVGLCSLGLPGLSGFVAEMTVFVGGWQNSEILPRVATIAAACSIVVTAVYILRAIGRTAMGPIPSSFAQLPDAQWNEKAAAILLLIAILAIGLSPNWLVTLLEPSSAQLIYRING